MKHLHLDPIGGVSADMFVAALLDAFPEHEAEVAKAVAELGHANCRTVRHQEPAQSGLRFAIHPPDPFLLMGADGPRHHAVPLADALNRIGRAALPAPVKRHAAGILQCWAGAEGRVRGIEPEAVTFHTSGPADPVSLTIAAAAVIAAMGPAVWSTGPVPLGGRTIAAPRLVPVPSPVAALLLEGMPVGHDGLPGERIKSLGAAILRHLGCGDAAPRRARLLRSGTGFGDRGLLGITDALRVLAFELAESVFPGSEDLLVISFELDGAAEERWSACVDRLRQMPSVLDVVRIPARVRHGGPAVRIEVFARSVAVPGIADACLPLAGSDGLRVHSALRIGQAGIQPAGARPEPVQPAVPAADPVLTFPTRAAGSPKLVGTRPRAARRAVSRRS